MTSEERVVDDGNFWLYLVFISIHPLVPIWLKGTVVFWLEYSHSVTRYVQGHVSKPHTCIQQAEIIVFANESIRAVVDQLYPCQSLNCTPELEQYALA